MFFMCIVSILAVIMPGIDMSALPRGAVAAASAASTMHVWSLHTKTRTDGKDSMADF